MSSRASSDEWQRAIRDRWSFDDPDLTALLKTCESASGDTHLTPERALVLTGLLSDYASKLRLFSPQREQT
jgi:hypothetical protein